MRKSLLFLIGIFLCVCISTTLAQQPRPQLPVKESQAADTGKIANFLTFLQGANSLVEVQTAFTQAQFSKAEVTELQRQIESSPTLKKKLDGLCNQEIAAAKIESAEETREEAKQTEMAKAQLNQKLLTAQQQSVNKIMQNYAAMSADPEARCQADAPTVSEVSEMRPGVQFAIRGMGLGKDPGTVDVMAGGFIFPAFINTWNSCGVTAQLSATIQGVRPDNQAAVSLKTSAGREVRFFTRFTPLYEVKHYSEHKNLWGCYFGLSVDPTFWPRVLRNDWFVLYTGVIHRHAGHAEITLKPPENTPNCSTLTKVHHAVGAFGWSTFTVLQRIAGPKGLLPY